MVVLLPPDLLDLIQQKCPSRELQIRQLATYYNKSFPCPPILVAYGLENASKREVIASVLQAREIEHVVINGRECLSQRHLLSKIFASCISAFAQEAAVGQYEKTDSINALLGNLGRLFDGVTGKRIVVVIEDVDELRQLGPTLLPALAHLGDLVPGFSIIFTSHSPRALTLHKSGVPYVHFPPYARSEAVSIITSRMKSPLPDYSQEETTVDMTVLTKLYPQFVATVYDSLISSTSSTSIQTFQSACDRLWPRFIEPFVTPKDIAGREKPWTFARLLVHHRGLFQSEGESALHRTLATRTRPNTADLLSEPPAYATHRTPLLKHFATLVLLSAYLACHTQQKHDMLLFSRMSTGSYSKRSRRSRQTPTKKRAASTPSGTPTKEATTPTKSRTKSLFAVNANAGVPRPFTLERLVAILRAIHPHGMAASQDVSDRVYREIGELEKLRLVVRLSGPGGSVASGEDAADEKWRVGVGRDWVISMGQAWGMGLSDYEIDTDL